MHTLSLVLLGFQISAYICSKIVEKQLLCSSIEPAIHKITEADSNFMADVNSSKNLLCWYKARAFWLALARFGAKRV